MNKEKQIKMIELKKWCDQQIYKLKCGREKIGRTEETEKSKIIVRKYTKIIKFYEDTLRQIAKETEMR